MAIAFDSELNSAGASFSFTNTAGNFMVAVACSNSATQLTATYNSVSMTIAGTPQQFDTQTNWLQVFTLMSPATGTNTLAFTGANKVFSATVTSYSGVKTTGQPEQESQSSVPNGTGSISKSVTTTSDNAWAALCIGANGAPTSYTNATARASNTFPYLADSNGPITPAGVFTQTASAAATPIAAIQVSFAPVTGAATAKLLPLTGVGS